MEVLRVVYDTNIYISGTFWLGSPKQALRLAKRGKVTASSSQSLMEELRDVLTRSEKPFCLSQEEAGKVIPKIQQYVRMVTPTRPVTICRDKSDNAVIECALAAEAQYIITGDPDLKDLSRFESIEIVTVRRFLEVCESLGIR